MNRLIILVFALEFLFVVPVSSYASDAKALVDRYEQAVQAIQSYDVLFNVDLLRYPSAKNVEDKDNLPTTLLRRTTRDVFAAKRGRRFEQNVNCEKEHSISVIDWATAVSAAKPLSTVLSYLGDGFTYSSYYNPDCEGRFLAELLRAPDARLRVLGGAHQVGIEVDSDKLRGPIRVWLDADHGYMPKAIEKYVRVDGKVPLLCRTVLDEFTRQDKNVWVPVKGAYNLTLLVGPARGRNHKGRAMTVDVESSTWNSIASSDLFAAKSLPSVNHERDGWKEFLPDGLLAAYKVADRIRNRMHRNIGAQLLRSRHLVVFVGVIILAVLLMLILIIWKKKWIGRLRRLSR